MHRYPAAFGLIAFAALSAGATAAEVQVTPTPGSAALAPTDPADSKTERLVCRKLTISGSRMPKRVCATKVEWEEQTKRNAQDLQDGQQDSDARSFKIPGSGGS